MGIFEIGLNDFCIMIWLQAMIWPPGMECGGLDENVPDSLMGGGTIGRCGLVGLGLTFREEVCHWGRLGDFRSPSQA